jgi:DNA-binding CsgD family transcriptional regulator/PAS domain-containing protein
MKDQFTIHLGKYLFEKDKILFLDLADKMQRMVFILDETGKITYLNCHAEKEFSWKLEEIRGEDFLERCQSNSIDATFLDGKIGRLFESFVPIEGDLYVTEETLIRVFACVSIPVREQEKYILMICWDVTDQRAQEQTTQEINNYLTSIFRYFPVGLFWKDKESKFLGGDERFLGASGWPHLDHLVGSTDFDCPWTKGAPIYREGDQSVMQTQRPKFNMIEEVTWANGQTYTMIVSKVPLFTPTNEVIGTVGMFCKLEEIEKQKHLLAMANGVLEETIVPENRRFCLKDAKTNHLIYLSKREKECFEKWALGKTSKEIARELQISHRTVEGIIFNLKQKLRVHTRSAMTDTYLENVGFWTVKK